VSENEQRRPEDAAATLTSTNGNTGSGDRLLTARELGEYLGMSASTVLDWWEAGRLPGYRLGGRSVRFRAGEIEAWLADCRVEARG
jgi:excisionase family DNA binding protein